MRPGVKVMNPETGEEFKSLSEAAKRYGFVSSVMGHWLKMGKLVAIESENFYQLEDETLDFDQPMCEVKCVTHNKKFNTIADAEKHYNYNRGTLLNRILEKNWRIDGLVWEYKDYGVILPKSTRKPRRNKAVSVLCVETGMIFKSVTDAAKYVSKSNNGIYSAIYANHLCAGYHWEFL